MVFFFCVGVLYAPWQAVYIHSLLLRLCTAGPQSIAQYQLSLSSHHVACLRGLMLQRIEGAELTGKVNLFLSLDVFRGGFVLHHGLWLYSHSEIKGEIMELSWFLVSLPSYTGIYGVTAFACKQTCKHKGKKYKRVLSWLLFKLVSSCLLPEP